MASNGVIIRPGRAVLLVIALTVALGSAMVSPRFASSVAPQAPPPVATERVAGGAVPLAIPHPGDLWVNPTDGAELVYIPAGGFVLGLSDDQIENLMKLDPTADRASLEEAQPQCRARTEGYWIGRTEVTNAQYLRFVRATGHAAPRYWKAGLPPAGTEDHPVTYVNWSDAAAYARWAGGRLPTELEWEKAARGTDGRLFPWGDAWAAGRCRDFHVASGHPVPMEWKAWVAALDAWTDSHEPNQEGVAAVGASPEDKSPYGCLDMAGNVFEWCADWFDPGAYGRYSHGEVATPKSGTHGLLRGGAWDRRSPVDYCTAVRSFHPLRIYRLHNAGFRYAHDPTQSPVGEAPN